MLFSLIAPKLKEVLDSRHEQKPHVTLDPPTPVPEEKVAPTQIVDEIAQRVLSGMPLRVINLSTGRFSSSAELLRTFKRSSEYQALVSDRTLAPDVLANQAEDIIHKYFAYVMLSHVWGEDEPLYGEVDAIANILEMSPSSPGTHKLQSFCRIAKQRGFRWCWSDTCCIDKTSSAELQESINSMFRWYRNSALTIAFLMDVLESAPDALERSRWFTRGWTLQELLAPAAIEFYMGDWTPFLPLPAGEATPPNYKLVPEFVRCLEDILGIDKSYLVDFTPGLDNVRERLRWVASRKTTKAEDMAYCLLGILDLHLPVLYGEGERAFVRLQDEIMKNTDDTCIFDWVGRPSSLNSYLARSPSCFRQPAWHLSPYQTTKELPVLGALSEFTHKISAAMLRVAESLLDEPPLGHFIANGRMNLRSFVYQVRSVKLTASSSSTTEVGDRKPGESTYWYRVEARGLEPLTVVTTYNLLVDSDSGAAARWLSIGRVWDNALRGVPSPTDADERAAAAAVADKANKVDKAVKKDKTDKTDKQADDSVGSGDFDLIPWSKNEDYLTTLGKRLQGPFVAQLLVVHPDGQFRRVHTEERIVAQPRLSELLDFRTPKTLIVH